MAPPSSWSRKAPTGRSRTRTSSSFAGRSWGLSRNSRSLVRSAAGVPGGFVFGVHVQRLTEGLPRLLAEAFLEIHPCQVRVRVEVAAIPRGGNRPLEPGDRLIEPFELDQVRADVVVRIPERRVHLDGALAFLDRGVVAAHETQSPSVERVGLCRCLESDRPFIGVRRPLQLPRTLENVRRLECASSRILARLLRLVERTRV